MKINFKHLFGVVFFLFASHVRADILELLPNDPNVKVGLYFGTFDPPHLGHLRVAQAAITSGSVDYVLFLPNNNASHKPNASPFYIRYIMSALTVANQNRILTPEVPFHREGYVKDILNELENRKPLLHLVGMIGTDVAAKAHLIFQEEKYWMGRVKSFLVNQRGGYETNLIPQDIEGRQVRTFSANDEGLSSTEIRKLVAGGSNELQKVVPADVVSIIKSYNLWGTFKSCRLVYF